MEILKEGKLPSERLIRGKCTLCRAEVQWKQSEGQVQSHRNEDYWFINCPTPKCGRQISGSPVKNND